MFTEEEIKKLKNMPLLKRSQALVEKVFFEKVDKTNNSYMIHLLRSEERRVGKECRL